MIRPDESEYEILTRMDTALEVLQRRLDALAARLEAPDAKRDVPYYTEGYYRVASGPLQGSVVQVDATGWVTDTWGNPVYETNNSTWYDLHERGNLLVRLMDAED